VNFDRLKKADLDLAMACLRFKWLSSTEVRTHAERQHKLCTKSFNPELEPSMNILNLSAAVMALGLLTAIPAFAETSPAQKQQTSEGGGASAPTPCGLPYNANSNADPNCKQQTQESNSAPLQVSPSTGQSK
jgi:hypothetical protein